MTLRELLANLELFFSAHLDDPNADYFTALDQKIVPGDATLIDGYEVLNRGNTRLVIRRPNSLWVWKIPIRPKGLIDNPREVDLYQRNVYPDARKAKCKLYTVARLPLLVMEYLTIELDYDVRRCLAPWSSHIDSHQIGLNRRGELKAYDYAASFENM